MEAAPAVVAGNAAAVGAIIGGVIGLGRRDICRARGRSSRVFELAAPYLVPASKGATGRGSSFTTSDRANAPAPQARRTPGGVPTPLPPTRKVRSVPKARVVVLDRRADIETTGRRWYDVEHHSVADSEVGSRRQHIPLLGSDAAFIGTFVDFECDQLTIQASKEQVPSTVLITVLVATAEVRPKAYLSMSGLDRGQRTNRPALVSSARAKTHVANQLTLSLLSGPTKRSRSECLCKFVLWRIAHCRPMRAARGE